MREVAGESVLLDLETEQYFGLDDVGTRIWQVLGESLSIRAALDVLLDEYEVDEMTLTRDVLALVAELADKGLVVVEHG